MWKLKTQQSITLIGDLYLISVFRLMIKYSNIIASKSRIDIIQSGINEK